MTSRLTERSYIEIGTLPGDLKIEKGSEEYNSLWNMRPGYRAKIKIFGKEYDMPREQQVYGVSNYSYSGTKFETQETPELLKKYLDWANEKESTDDKYNMILVNWYHNGEDNIGWHKDNEREIKEGSNVMTISLGGSRKFKIKHDTNNELKMDIETQHNGYIVMGGDFQKEFKHSIPKSKSAKYQEGRISITLRKFK